MCSNRWDKIAHDKIPSIAGFRLRKALANEKCKVPPSSYEEDTGNRHPDDPVSVACRQNMMANIESGAPGSIKTDGLNPHFTFQSQ